MSQDKPEYKNSKFEILRGWKGIFGLILFFGVGLGFIIYGIPGQKTASNENVRKEHEKNREEISFTPTQKLVPVKKADKRISTPMDKLAEGLAKKLKENPKDGAGWALLGRSYTLIGEHGKAVRALEKAIELTPKDSELLATYGNALVALANGAVDQKSKEVFLEAIKLNPVQPVAKLNLALVDFNAGKVKEAYNVWAKLAKEAPPNAPYLTSLQTNLNLAAEKLGIEAPSILPKTPLPIPSQNRKPNLPSALTMNDVNPANKMSSDQTDAFIRGMVQRLADKLEKNPNDLGGWLKLAKSQIVLGEKKKALTSYQNALRIAPNDQFILSSIKSLGETPQ